MTQTITARRTRRWIWIAIAAAAGLAVWTLAVPLAGVDLTVGSGAAAQTVGPVAVVTVSLVTGAAAWALLAFLQARFRHGRRAWQIIAGVVLVLSLLGPAGMGASGAALAVLIAMHLAVGAVLILGLPRRHTR
jgi:hypothetical protein